MGNQSFPDENGRFGDFGGRFVAETLMPPILELEKAYEDAKADPKFAQELDYFMTHYVGRPSPLYFAERLSVMDKPLIGRLSRARRHLNALPSLVVLIPIILVKPLQ